MEMLYRVTYNNEGIYNELKKVVGRDIWLHLLSLKEINWLPKPPTYANENKSYFTQKGFDRFKEETLPLICKYLDKDNIKIETFEKVDNIIYFDEYQVVIDDKC